MLKGKKFMGPKIESMGKNERIKSNQELVAEIKKECPRFEDFWNKILEQARENKGQIYNDINPSPINVYRLFASHLGTIVRNQNIYEREIPIEFYNDNMSILQKTITGATIVYFEQNKILNDDGTLMTQ